MRSSNKLIHANELKQIPYLDKETQKLSYLTPDEFQKKYSAIYTESLFANQQDIHHHLDNTNLLTMIQSVPDQPNDAAVLDRLEHPLQDLALYDAGENVGSGLIALKDIPPGTVLFLYSGHVEAVKTIHMGYEYDYLWMPREINPHQVINATHYRGLSGFLQHLPIDSNKHKAYLKKGILEKIDATRIAAGGIDIDQYINEITKPSTGHELTNLIFKDAAVKMQLATSNVRPVHTVIKGIPVVVCVTDYGIKKGEIAGFDYGFEYGKEKTPRYFTKKGDLIPIHAYTNQGSSRDTVSIRALLQCEKINPLVKYQEGIAFYKSKQYLLARESLLQALDQFIKKLGENVIECANCYSTLASCQRELGESIQAAQSCEKAMAIFSKVDPLKLEKTAEKHLSCLKLIDQTYEYYETGIKFYKHSEYKVAQKYLLAALEQFSKKNQKEEMATCHSALASCYRELKNSEQAIMHGEQALSLRTELYEPTDRRVTAMKEKLEKLQSHGAIKRL